MSYSIDDYGFGTEIDSTFGLFGFLFALAVIFIIGSSIAQFIRNNNSPVLVVNAQLVDKYDRTSHSTHDAGSGAIHTNISTSYHLLFEVEGGERLSFTVRHSEYNLLATGDTGKLTFQGTRYKGFVRLDRSKGF